MLRCNHLGHSLHHSPLARTHHSLLAGRIEDSHSLVRVVELGTVGTEIDHSLHTAGIVDQVGMVVRLAGMSWRSV